jgi:lauroyl/myristoyl acyltransferase
MDFAKRGFLAVCSHFLTLDWGSCVPGRNDSAVHGKYFWVEKKNSLSVFNQVFHRFRNSTNFGFLCSGNGQSGDPSVHESVCGLL